MAKLFFSYRRSDCGAYADRLAECLSKFQFEAVFLDRDGIRLGDNFADRIRTAISQCDAVLVLMGKTWITVQDETGGRRLDDPKDWVRREVAMALASGAAVVPVLFDAAPKPAAADLPEELAPLATKQGYDINGNYFNRDANDLGGRLEALLVTAGRGKSTGPVRDVKRGFIRQLLIIWLALCTVTAAVSVAPGLPESFWIFPGTMALAAFLWWLYWFGESQRTALLRTTG